MMTMVSFRGFVRRFHPKSSVCIFLISGLFFLAFSLSSTSLFVRIDEDSYAYNTYNGLPLTVYDHVYNIRINQSECANSKVVIVIHSAVTNFDVRTTIRTTWANKALLQHYNMKLVFFLGKPFKEEIQILVNKESDEHNDIVQGNFIDAYTNLTHKAVLWLRWVSSNCHNANTILKLDDDVFVNLFSFNQHLSIFSDHKHQIWCDVIPAGTQRIQRRSGLKWRVAEHELRGLSHYPLTLCRGYFVVLTRNIIKSMYQVAKQTPFFWIDDYYIFGTLANKTGAQFSSLPYLVSEDPRRMALQCFVSKSSTCHLMGVLLDSYNDMHILWKHAVRQQNLQQ